MVKVWLAEICPEAPEYRDDVLMQHKNEMYLTIPKWLLTNFDTQDNGIQAYDFLVPHW
jgi:hypothetical protein